MKARIKWVQDAMFLGESGSGHSVVMDGPEDHGGRNLGVRPMEMLLMGLGGCSSFDVMSILKKSRQNVVDCVAELDAERADAVPSVFTKIHMPYLRNSFFLITILISLEIIKELPMTLILRPFNFETFATQAYIYASQDLLEAASLPSLFLIFWSVVMLFFTSKYILLEK